ncbi:unnamed protein product [Vitrella brassicaformis CCMP3155]|uniref:Uncharacterized protein n=1 Tax=Vitrella brassicaformis (strain CCMP3155) TaxID=1169540 RepID=A0A0G4FA39_VITBC|nr:unnamed protein product [Vitrella brassicaformis CCMP3155]|eukprot:CEM09151.1 unnamed protein product [Vitrella brassicaformis CCMP3155]
MYGQHGGHNGPSRAQPSQGNWTKDWNFYVAFNKENELTVYLDPETNKREGHDHFTMDDNACVEFCTWLRMNLPQVRPKGGAPLTAVVNMANNRIGDRGVKALTECFLATDVQPRILKLYKNQIAGDGMKALAQMVHDLKGPISEIHLSHNKIDEMGATALVAAIANHPKKVYPRRMPNGKYCPVWLRLEYNLISNHDKLLRFVQQKGISICTETKRAFCGPTFCKVAESGKDCPLLHLYALNHQGEGRAPNGSMALTNGSYPAPGRATQHTTPRGPPPHHHQQQPPSTHRPALPPPQRPLGGGPATRPNMAPNVGGKTPPGGQMPPARGPAAQQSVWQPRPTPAATAAAAAVAAAAPVPVPAPAAPAAPSARPAASPPEAKNPPPTTTTTTTTTHTTSATTSKKDTNRKPPSDDGFGNFGDDDDDGEEDWATPPPPTKPPQKQQQQQQQQGGGAFSGGSTAASASASASASGGGGVGVGEGPLPWVDVDQGGMSVSEIKQAYRDLHRAATQEVDRLTRELRAAKGGRP